MRKTLLFSLSAASIILVSACSSKLGALSADNFNVSPNPLETQGGKVPATINGTFPKKYMKKKAVVTVTPELRYANGQVARGNSATFQGEKVRGNDQTIPYRVGGNYTMRTSFDYVPDMQKSELFLTFDARVGKKTVNVPAVKIANGVLATSELYRKTLTDAGGCIAPDSFQRVRTMKQEANVKFLINQAKLRQTELKNNSVQEFTRMLKKINADRQRLNMKDVAVRAYASPDGGVSFNDKLANKRQNVSEEYVKQQLKQAKTNADIDAAYTAQDWDGFQQLVSASNIQDKDIILRVLSMYQDPEERERQIRNMSTGFRELADEILPQLRRSRLIINYEAIGRSDDEIKNQYVADASKLSLEELLYLATLQSNDADKEEVYKKATTLYANDYRAYNNVAVMEFNRGNDMEAQSWLNKARNLNPNAPEISANDALLALKAGKIAEAENALAKATGANDYNEVLGNLNIAKGNYAQAQENLRESNSNSAILAQILNKDYATAATTLRNKQKSNAMTHYLRAILNARQGDKTAASAALKDAVAQDPALAAYAANDLELSDVAQ